MGLFREAKPDIEEPLAARMRPRNLEEFVGQEHLLGEGRLLRKAIEEDKIGSMIFYGPPGAVNPLLP
jgi:putative ATPase